jgi:hypothetical protein
MRRQIKLSPPVTPKCDKARGAVLATRNKERAKHINIYEALALFDTHEPRSKGVVQKQYGCHQERADGVITQLLTENLLRVYVRNPIKYLLTEDGVERLEAA